MKTLVQHGNFLALAAAEHEDMIWKSYMFSLKQGTLNFLVNAAIDTLPTAANLCKWKKSTSNKSKLWREIQTTSHILNICQSSLENGKFLWRHNNLVNYIVNCLDTVKFTVYADLPGHTVGGGTIPAEICITPQMPDIVLIDNKEKTINLFELTVPIEHNIDIRHQEKSDKYSHFLTDCSGFKCNVTAFEIGSRGYISTRNHSALYSLHKFSKLGYKLSKFKENSKKQYMHPTIYLKQGTKKCSRNLPSYCLPSVINSYVNCYENLWKHTFVKTSREALSWASQYWDQF